MYKGDYQQVLLSFSNGGITETSQKHLFELKIKEMLKFFMLEFKTSFTYVDHPVSEKKNKYFKSENFFFLYKK